MSNDVEGYTKENPVPNKDWLDVVRWEVNRRWHEKSNGHDTDGYTCDLAGSPSCLALGHVEDPDEGWGAGDGHPYGWDGDRVCPDTRYADACTACEADLDWCEMAEYKPMSTRAEFWKLVSA